MSKFNIEICDEKPKKIAGRLCCYGKITIGSYVESFIMSLGSWDVHEYKKQWHEGLERIKKNNISCLVTDISEAKNNLRVNFWALYKIGDNIFVQNQILGGEILEERKVGLPDYSARTCYSYVQPRRTENMYGHKVDEWHLKVSDFMGKTL
jgi:hypothetical protein